MNHVLVLCMHVTSECISSASAPQIEELRLLLELADGPEEKIQVTNELKALLKSPAPVAPSIPLAAPLAVPSDACPATPQSDSSATNSEVTPTTAATSGEQQAEQDTAGTPQADGQPDLAEDLLGNGGFEQ